MKVIKGNGPRYQVEWKAGYRVVDKLNGGYVGDAYPYSREAEESARILNLNHEREAENARMDAAPLSKLPGRPVEKVRGIRI